MSEGRTPTATLTEQRQLEQNDIDALHEIVNRAQSNPECAASPQKALFEAYASYFETHEDKACFNIVLQILNPTTAGANLYERFENVLRNEGIALSFDDDTASQATRPSMPEESASVQGSLISRKRNSMDSLVAQHPRMRSVSLDNHRDDGSFDSHPTQIAVLMQFAEAWDRRTLLRQSLNQLRGTLRMRRALRQANAEAVAHRQELDANMVAAADAHYEHCLKRKAFKQLLCVYRDQQEMIRQADGMYQDNLLRRTFGLLDNEYRIHQVQAIDDERVMGFTLYKWAIAAREKNFIRKREQRLKWRCLVKMVNSFRQAQAKAAEMESILEREQDAKDTATKGAIIELWLQRYREIQAMTTNADRVYDDRLQTAVFATWQNRMKQLRDMEETAADAREYFLLRWTLRQFRRVVERRKTRREILGKWVLSRWRLHTERRKTTKYDEAYRQMRRTVKTNLGRRILHRWHERVVDIGRIERNADDFCNISLMQRVVHPAVEGWYDRAMRVRANQEQADVHYDETLKRKALQALEGRAQHLTRMNDMSNLFQQQKSDEVIRKCLRQMQMKAFEMKRREEDAEAFRTRKEKRIIREAWDRLRLAYAQRRGQEPPLDLPPATPSQRRAAELSRLSTTPAYTPFAARLRGEAESSLRETVRILEEVEEQPEGETTFM